MSEQVQLFYAIVNGMQIGPLPADELLKVGINGETPLWTTGETDWRSAAEFPDVAQKIGSHKDLRSLPTYRQSPNGDFLFFDPLQPKVMGLIVLYSLVFSPIIFFAGSCHSLSTMETPISPGERFLSLWELISVPIDFIFVAVAFIGAIGLRSRRPFGYWFTIGVFSVNLAKSILIILAAALLGAMGAFEPDTSAEIPQMPFTSLDLFMFVLSFASGCFELFALCWLLISRKRIEKITIPTALSADIGGKDHG